MDLRQLRYFVTIVDKKSYTKAAKILHVSQPSLSNTIKNLEQEVGFRLLERSTRKIHLTASGEVLYKRALELLCEFENIKKEMEEVKIEGTGTITIGLIESTKSWLPKVIKLFRVKYPHVKIQLIDILGKKNIYEALKKYDIHFAITNEYISQPDMEMFPIYDEKLELITNKNHPLNEMKTIQLSDLTEEPFIISKPSFQTRKDILNAFSSEGLAPNILYETERFETACSLVREGLGISIIPESYLQSSFLESLRIRQINNNKLTRIVYLSCLKDRYLPPIIYDLHHMIQRFFHRP